MSNFDKEGEFKDVTTTFSTPFVETTLSTDNFNEDSPVEETKSPIFGFQFALDWGFFFEIYNEPIEEKTEKKL